MRTSSKRRERSWPALRRRVKNQELEQGQDENNEDAVGEGSKENDHTESGNHEGSEEKIKSGIEFRRRSEHFEALVAVVVRVVDGARVAHGGEEAANDLSDVDDLLAEIVVLDGDVGENDLGEDIAALVHLKEMSLGRGGWGRRWMKSRKAYAAALAGNGTIRLLAEGLDLRAEVEERLVARADVERLALEDGGQQLGGEVFADEGEDLLVRLETHGLGGSGNEKSLSGRGMEKMITVKRRTE